MPSSFALSIQPFVNPDLENKNKCTLIYENKLLRFINVSSTPRPTFSLVHLHSPNKAVFLSCSPIISISVCFFSIGSFPHQRPSSENSIGELPSRSSSQRYCLQISSNTAPIYSESCGSIRLYTISAAPRIITELLLGTNLYQNLNILSSIEYIDFRDVFSPYGVSFLTIPKFIKLLR